MKKKILNLKQFHKLNNLHLKKMKNDKVLQKKALDVLIKADKYRWVHKSTWLGAPLLNLPEDMFQIQEIIFNTRPDYIIETGIAWGGSALFYASILNLIGGKKFIGIDIFIPSRVRKLINKNKILKNKIKLIRGSSIDKLIVIKIKKLIKKSKKVLIILDSNHTHDHVLKELELYSNFVGKGQYLICGDTIINDIPVQTHRKREWNKEKNPQTALNEFMKKNPNKFKVDKNISFKLLFSTQPRGYLVSKK